VTTTLGVETTEPLPPSTRRRGRQFWLLTAVGVVVLALIGGGISALVYVHTYQPLGPATFRPTGSATPRTLKVLTDGIDVSRYALVGPRGTTGTVEYSLANNGRFGVRLLGLDATNYPFVSDLAWSGPNADGAGTPQAARPFPMTLGPGDQIFLQVTVLQPTCGLATYTIGAIPIRYDAFGIHHVWQFPLGGESENLPITLCAPRSVDRYQAKL
jgi:hypothetical protein